MTGRIFISHGHNQLAMHRLRDFVRDRLEMTPVVLAEQPDLGLTIVEKLEHYGRECCFALILLTADDDTASGGARARQNVIHELGFFHALLGRKKVLLLKEEEVELFSNISGLIYKEFPKDRIKETFEDVRLAIESDDASEHARTVPPKKSKKPTEYSKGDHITAALVGAEHAEKELKKLAASLARTKPADTEEMVNAITAKVEERIEALQEKHTQGGDTDETRLDACIAGVVSDIIQRELANFQWAIDEHPDESPLSVFRQTVKAFMKAEKDKWK